MSETTAEKQARIESTEHELGAVPEVGLATATFLSAFDTGREPIDAPFHVVTAHRSKWYAPRGAAPTSVVLHCTAGENPASAVAAYFAADNSSGSTQAVVDDDQGFTCVPDNAVCAGAPPLNQEGLHIEMVGSVTRSRAAWLSHNDTLLRAANRVREWCATYQIPKTLLHAPDLKRLGERARGITYHAAVSEAFHQSTHTDPMPNFPFDVFMTYVTTNGGDMLTPEQEEYLKGMMRFNRGDGAPPDTASDQLKRGYKDSKDRFDRAMANPPAGGLKPFDATITPKP